MIGLAGLIILFCITDPVSKENAEVIRLVGVALIVYWLAKD